MCDGYRERRSDRAKVAETIGAEDAFTAALLRGADFAALSEAGKPLGRMDGLAAGRPADLAGLLARRDRGGH
ncbi:MAG: hypothetical protein ACRD3N_01910 [Terracidiphilus sp.]